uniref:Protein SSD1 n=1 Tax=Ogataea thermomethanolica (nom. inval.) TaxID=310468 RepID=A0A5P8D0Y2_9ASCO|nr:protein SSD1 [Ogataea thermomethanolica (nom. inval.)]QGW56841.1 hypothetical protein [Ogataea thermomethanolica (nom. inval.)]
MYNSYRDCRKVRAHFIGFCRVRFFYQNAPLFRSSNTMKNGIHSELPKKTLAQTYLNLLGKPESAESVDEHVESALNSVKKIMSLEHLHYGEIEKNLKSVLSPNCFQHQSNEQAHLTIDQTELFITIKLLLQNGELGISRIAPIVFKMDHDTIQMFIEFFESDPRFKLNGINFICQCYVLICFRLRQLGLNMESDKILQGNMRNLFLPAIQRNEFLSKKYLRNLVSLLVVSYDVERTINLVKESSCLTMVYALIELKPTLIKDLRMVLTHVTKESDQPSGLTKYQKLILYLLSNRAAYSDVAFVEKVFELSKKHRLSYGECTNQAQFFSSLMELLEKKKFEYHTFESFNEDD